MTALPPHLAADLARVRTALRSPAAGSDVPEAQAALDRLEAALVATSGQQARFNALAVSVFALGHDLRAYLRGQPYDRKADDDLLAAMCDAEELAT